MPRRMTRKVISDIEWTETKGQRPDETDEEFFHRFSDMDTDDQISVLRERCSSMHDDCRETFTAMVEYMEDFYSQLQTFAPSWIAEGIAPLIDSLGKFILFVVRNPD